jgi:hypothetical protein
MRQVLTACTASAETIRSVPSMVLEQPFRPYSKDDLQSSTSKSFEPSNSDVIPSGIHQRGTMSIVDQIQNDNLRWIANTNPETVRQLRMSQLQHQQAVKDGVSRNIPLDEGQIYKPLQLPESPVAYLPFRQASKEQVYELFGVPTSFVSNGSSTGKSSLGSSGSSTNTQTTFENKQKAIKLQLISEVTYVYRTAFEQEHVEQFIQDWKALKRYERRERWMQKQQQRQLYKQQHPLQRKRKKPRIESNKYREDQIFEEEDDEHSSSSSDSDSDADVDGDKYPFPLPSKSDIIEAMSIEVEMPGMPDDKKLFDAYKMGALKYEVLFRYQRAKHGYAKDAWHATPKVTLDVLNDVQLNEETELKGK